ncbi:MAG: CHAD domain-containing protein [Geminicoccaceae bacterium]
MKTVAKKTLPIEAELRLAGEPNVLKGVFASSQMALEAGRKDKIRNLESRYFDTPEQDLRACGLAFRVRTDGDGHCQTLKAGDDAQAALTRRGEWEMALEDDRPRPEALPKAARKRMPKSVWKGGLEQAFKTRVRRQMREVVVSDADGRVARIEAALDLGAIETRAGGLPIAEIEFELLEGPPETLYRLALELQEIGPLHLETRSKSTRAFDRLADQPPGWRCATTPEIGPADSVDDAMATIFESCFAHWLANQAAVVDGRDPEGVHQMRVALRRLRSAVSVFRKLIPPDQYIWLQEEAKRVIGALGPARDWDVFQGDLLAPVIEARPEDPDLIALSKRARGRQRAGYRRARNYLESPDYTRFVLRFGQWLEQRAWRKAEHAGRVSGQARPVVDFARQLLNRRRKRTLAKGRNFAELTTEQRHELRLVLKKLRYAIAFFRTAFDGKTVKPFLHSVKTLQDGLGHLNDVAVAEALLADLIARPGKDDVKAAAGLIIGWHARGVAMIEPELCRDWEAFQAEPVFWR